MVYYSSVYCSDRMIFVEISSRAERVALCRNVTFNIRLRCIQEDRRSMVKGIDLNKFIWNCFESCCQQRCYLKRLIRQTKRTILSFTDVNVHSVLGGWQHVTADLPTHKYYKQDQAQLRSRRITAMASFSVWVSPSMSYPTQSKSKLSLISLDL